MDASCLKQLFLWCLPNGDFLFPSLLLHLLIEELFSFFPIYLSIQFLIYISVDSDSYFNLFPLSLCRLHTHCLYPLSFLSLPPPHLLSLSPPISPPSLCPTLLPFTFSFSHFFFFFFATFFLAEEIRLSRRVSVHWVWLSASSWCHLMLSSIPWVSCELVVTPEAWSDARLTFLARPCCRWLHALPAEAHEVWWSPFRDMEIDWWVQELSAGPSIVKFPISFSSAGFRDHW